MPNSKDKTQYSQVKTLSNSLRLKSPHSVKSRQNVANILIRLPFLRKLNETQNQLLRVTPVWQQWCTDQSNSIIADFASPASLEGGVLTLSCKQSSTATILKHQQSSLLKALNSQGFENVQSIRVQMSLNQPLSESNKDRGETMGSDSATQEKNQNASETSWVKPSAASLKSIEVAYSRIENEQLAASLKRLAETLKKAP